MPSVSGLVRQFFLDVSLPLERSCRVLRQYPIPLLSSGRQIVEIGQVVYGEGESLLKGSAGNTRISTGCRKRMTAFGAFDTAGTLYGNQSITVFHEYRDLQIVVGAVVRQLLLDLGDLVADDVPYEIALAALHLLQPRPIFVCDDPAPDDTGDQLADAGTYEDRLHVRIGPGQEHNL